MKMAEGVVKSLVSDREKELECCICLDREIENAKLLKCLHTYCDVCLTEKLDKGGVIECPQCKVETHLPQNGVEGLPPNFLFNRIRELIKAGQSLQCGCSRGIVKFYCFHCKVFLCKQCTDSHNDLKPITGGHTVVELNKFSGDDIDSYLGRSGSCKKHNGKEQKFYCQPCDQCICIECTVVDHQNHQRSDLIDVVKQEKEVLGGKVLQIKAKKNFMEFQCKLLDNQVETIKNEAESAKATAKQTYESIIKEATKKMRETLNEIDNQADDNIRKVTAMKSKVLNKEQEMEKYVQFSNGILDRSIPLEIMELKNLLKGRFQELNRERPSQYSVEQFHIKYNRNEPEVTMGIKALRQVGDIQTCCIDPKLTELKGYGIRKAFVGEDARFIVETKTTRRGDKAFSFKDYVTVEIESPDSERIVAKVEEKWDGKYSVNFTPKCCGEHKVCVWVNGEEIADVPRLLMVNANSPKKFESAVKLEGSKARQQKDYQPLEDTKACVSTKQSQPPSQKFGEFVYSRNTKSKKEKNWLIDFSELSISTDNKNFTDDKQLNVGEGSVELWPCSRCTFDNSPYTNICEICGCTRDVAEPKPPSSLTQTRICPNCTYANNYNAKKCVICHKNVDPFHYV